MKKAIKKSSGKMTLDRLATMVQKGFLSLEEKIKSTRDELKSDIKEVKGELTEVKSNVEDIKTDLNRRVHIFDHKDLEFRVEKLEEKAGIIRRK